MNIKLYEAIRPVRGRGPEKIEGHWFINFADIYPKSFSSMIIGGWLSLMVAVALYCLYFY